MSLDRPQPLTPAGRSRNGVAKGLTALSIGAAITKILTLASGLVIARALGPVRTGELLASSSLLGVALVLTDMGIGVSTVRDIVAEAGNFSRLISTTVYVQLVGGVTAGTALAVIALFAPLPPHSALYLLLALPALLSLALNLSFALQARDDMRRLSLSRVVSTGVTAVGSMALVVTTHNPATVVVMGWLGAAISDVVTFRWLHRHYGLRLTAVPVSECWQLFLRAWPLLQNGALYVLVLNVDTISLSILGNPREVGVYGGAWSLSFTTATLTLLVTDASFPEMVRRAAISADDLLRFTEKLLVPFTRAALAVMAYVVVASSPIVVLLLGHDYAASGRLLRLLFVLTLLVGLSTIVGFAVIASGGQRDLVRRRVVTAAVAGVGCPLAAAYGDDYAVAVVIVAANVVELVLFCQLANKRGGLPRVRRLAGQLDYLVVPALLMEGLERAVGHLPLLALLGPWAIGVLVCEAARGFPTLSMARQVTGRPRR